jgi:hypothetical protein
MMADYGVLKPLVESAGVIVNVGLAIAGLLFGKAGFDPPVPARSMIVRILSILCGVIAALMWKFGRGQLDTLTFETIAIGAAIASMVSLVTYAIAFFALCLTCEDDPSTRYLMGLRLRPQARAVLAGDRNQLLLMGRSRSRRQTTGPIFVIRVEGQPFSGSLGRSAQQKS